ncbi:YdiU family protein [Chryseobacterium indologenes]|uniref:protein adenylyltransferase SelO n=1 Tax=Chryseobacterium indologenes TaxID=253 RepID=UPI000F51339C|nr:YdiU family protein [Chryseobacterium indologenes]AYZ37674.1 YdiU family protein [Chryseobacterium indologenes]MBF6646562.1 YdiU family protein [Chryseobacterium indologenes]MBU3046981.1 YdiU family protein [Chryseobacterium indologenes]MEB4760409.1 YdiU family protein [Chryseobacterium indologenes]QQQ69773.1 YdiU family protein [Chryseobacterium indologenes]
MNIERIRQPFIKKFPGDFSNNLMQRNTPKVLFATTQPAGFDKPALIAFNETLAEEIGLGKFEEKDLNFLAGNQLPDNIQTYATAYAGHQFGNWAGQLGDGRAILAGEITNEAGKKTEIQWKGAGATPYSRHADGRAVLRSSVREYLMSEAMFHLGVPTTRALSLVLTGEDVVRDIMYSGNPQYEKGAVIIRTAESFLRFGHFELMSAQGEYKTLQDLTDFTIENYFPEITSSGDQKYKDFFENVCTRTANLMTEWFRVGFVHGVMNTDNMSILGLTIDYGPYSMMDEYDLNFTPNTTDLPGRRYAFGKQGQISQWNLWQLANALHPLVKDEKFLENTLNNFGSYFWEAHDKMLCRKFGFDELLKDDEDFFTSWQGLMQELQLDYTLFFNVLEKINPESDLQKLFRNISYGHLNDESLKKIKDFIKRYELRSELNTISKEDSVAMMKESNPKFILRNYLLYQCIEEINNGKTEMLDKLTQALENPYQELFPEFSSKRPSGYDDIAGCSTLSCSS